ncbi:uncharacterized protein HMPREF1541_00739 [Cyphellophora europaea CBS 101466]|uniref:Clr5 domain-containing protein n=1 Tax=Cyphellophora europaea (strain CBS 101466) TaxID=1220924 RepID=W2SF76_CYPE1|nr:uncharacterized protein HMPREF1541_00739 [Cyphellophora europaea CBS 101466]ETN46554.1 hypothetical protein HMPREF1541_00739 [Cyphellophora europaea CBS 101466]
MCHGLGCSDSAGADYERRRVCLWCSKTLPHLGATSRQAWNQKIFDARTRNALSRQADMEEYNRKRLRMMRMSRREMRGDQAVLGDPDADVPQFVRHLDSCCNYRNFVEEKHVPSGEAVYQSKNGYWRYTRGFLLRIGESCLQSKQLQRRFREVATVTREGSCLFSRSIKQRDNELSYMGGSGNIHFHGRRLHGRGKRFELPGSEARLAQWATLKTRILSMAFIERLEFCQIQAILQSQYDFDMLWEEFRSMLNVWNLTPLWEGSEKSSSVSLTKDSTDDDETGTTPTMGRIGKSSRKEAKMEAYAARVIERLVLDGEVLPLRTTIAGPDERKGCYEAASPPTIDSPAANARSDPGSEDSGQQKEKVIALPNCSAFLTEPRRLANDIPQQDSIVRAPIPLDNRHGRSTTDQDRASLDQADLDVQVMDDDDAAPPPDYWVNVSNNIGVIPSMQQDQIAETEPISPITDSDAGRSLDGLDSDGDATSYADISCIAADEIQNDDDLWEAVPPPGQTCEGDRR